ncbi:chaperone NapD [Lysobacter sp. MMG2]|uniref:chaperone NapD n=1 Tax=Lysobacter sp. MMG2 TaxID=2801338 RepID=UPI001C21BD2F|nr:chaperone NapD [Lysobacter sp. MMG2]MBU8976794.1 chaperone NapD [Lysobacter sp. MMG2]
MKPDENADVHIASFVVQHRAEAIDAMVAHIDATADLELALRGDIRSVVLCECADQYAVLDRMDALRALPGVLNVALVYHHAEPREALDAPVQTAPDIAAPGVAP